MSQGEGYTSEMTAFPPLQRPVQAPPSLTLQSRGSTGSATIRMPHHPRSALSSILHPPPQVGAFFSPFTWP